MCIDGDKTSPLALGGLDGFLNLCESLRDFDEFKYVFPASKADYLDGETRVPFNIMRINRGSSILFTITNVFGESICIASTSLMQMLKFERLIAATIEKDVAGVESVENNFNIFINNAVSDMSEAWKTIEKKGDFLLIEIVTNFNDLVIACIDKCKSTSMPAPVGKKPSKRGSKSMTNLTPVKKAKGCESKITGSTSGTATTTTTKMTSVVEPPNPTPPSAGISEKPNVFVGDHDYVNISDECDDNNDNNDTNIEENDEPEVLI